MIFAILAVGCFFLALRDGLPFLAALRPAGEAELLAAQRAQALFLELEETLLAGTLPRAERWEALGRLPEPWGKLASDSVTELRTRGGQIVPTLQRLRDLAESHEKSLREGKARSAQALAQAMVCVAIVPVFGSLLFLLLPGLEESAGVWISVCAVAMALGSAGGLWMLKLSENARWAGLACAERPWWLATQCAGERFLSLVRSGVASDQAWTQTVQALDPELAGAWGASVWEEGSPARTGSSEMGRALAAWGPKARKAIHVAILEGQACQERLEALLAGLRVELKAAVDRELQLLGARVLKPLFVCVAPSILGLLVAGMVLCWRVIGVG